MLLLLFKRKKINFFSNFSLVLLENIGICVCMMIYVYLMYNHEFL